MSKLVSIGTTVIVVDSAGQISKSPVSVYRGVKSCTIKVNDTTWKQLVVEKLILTQTSCPLIPKNASASV